MNNKVLFQLLEAAEGMGLDSIAVSKKGKPIMSAYQYPYQKDQPHVMYSATKSVISTLAGLLIDQGELSLDRSVLSYFPEHTPENPSPHKDAMTLKHLLTMTTGHECDSLNAIMQAKSSDWVKVFLNQPVPLSPGSKFVYDSGASYIITAIMSRVLGCSVRDFADEKLFKPMAITNYSWQTCPKGIHIGGWGLYLTTDDMMKFGQLFLNEGVYGDRRLIPLWWVKEATTKHSHPDDGGYGYQWWMMPWGYCAAGMGGQKIYIVPEHDLIVAVTMSGTGDFNDAPDTMMNDFILKALKDGSEADENRYGKMLQELVANMKKGPQAKPMICSRNSREIQKKTFEFPAPTPLHSLMVDIKESSGILTMEWMDQFKSKHKTSLAFGLDNQYRTSSFNLTDSPVDMFEYTELFIRAHYTGDRVLEFEVRYPGELFTCTWQLSFFGEKLRFRTLNQTMSLLPWFDETIPIRF